MKDNMVLGRLYLNLAILGENTEWVRRLLSAEFAAWLDLQVLRVLTGAKPESTWTSLEQREADLLELLPEHLRAELKLQLRKDREPGSKKAYHVWYAKFPFNFRTWGIFARTLHTSHALVRTIPADDLEDVFRQMQAEEWSPNGEARSLIEALELTHTSMCVGDVIEEATTHRLFIVEPAGFRFIGNNPSSKVPQS